MKIEENKTHSIHLRLNESQYQFCKTMAETADLGIADFIRILVNTTKVATEKAQAISLKVSDELNDNAKLGDLYANNTNDI